jgi:hypothetical protein
MARRIKHKHTKDMGDSDKYRVAKKVKSEKIVVKRATAKSPKPSRYDLLEVAERSEVKKLTNESEDLAMSATETVGSFPPFQKSEPSNEDSRAKTSTEVIESVQATSLIERVVVQPAEPEEDDNIIHVIKKQGKTEETVTYVIKVFIDDDMGNEYSENDFVEKFNYCVQETDI